MFFGKKRKNKEKCLRCPVTEEHPKPRFTTKLFFWLFVLLIVLSLFLLWGGGATKTNPALYIAALIALCLGVFLGLIVFIRFIRSRSVTGGLFLTTCISTGVFLGISQIIPVIVPPTAAAFSAAPDVTNNGFQLLITLSQIGLFAIWFGFLLFTIFLYVSPVKRIDKYLDKIVLGEKVRHVRIGKARQYKAIEQKILEISQMSKSERGLATEDRTPCPTQTNARDTEDRTPCPSKINKCSCTPRQQIDDENETPQTAPDQPCCE